jgi:signal transduction histidine kinase
VRSTRWRPVAWAVGGAFSLVTVVTLVFATASWKHPFAQTSPTALVGLLWVLPFIGGLATALVAIVVRFRGSTGDERLQLKWFVTGAVLVVATFFASFAFTNPPPILSVLQSLAFVFLYTAIGIAVLKYRLYEIDIVISKTLVYGILAAFFTAVYVAVVVGVGTAVGSTRSPFLTVLAAALIALAFNPVRNRAKRFANRAVYGKRATPYEVLSEFADRMAGTYSVEDVLPRTARMLAEGTGAIRADVWLRVGAELRAEGSWPSTSPREPIPVDDAGPIDVPGATRVVAVRHQGEMLGALSIRKAPGDPVSPTEDKLLADVASQAGLVLRNVRLIEELRASRQRIVAAQDQERRKLERNIHDGAQQQLVALAVKANLAESMVGRDEERTRALLAQLKAEAHEALENLRDLARGIYPPLLADQGLVAALTAQARKSPIPVSVEANGIGRFPQDAEAAVYFCALEALQNVAKYAGASQATVHLDRRDGHLGFEVADDGVGFDPAAKGEGTGMQGMADRLAALGGGLSVTSSPGAGTKVTGTVPVAFTD